MLPVNVRIYSNQYHTSPQSSPLVAGQIAEFGCKTDGSKPAASIEWFLDHQRIVIANSINYPNYYGEDEETTTTLTNSVLSEVKTTNSGTPLQSNNSSFIIAPLPLSVPFSLSSSSLPAGKFLSIIGSYKANSTLSVIRFVPHYTDNGRILSCHAWNPFIANSKIADKLALDVKCK